MTTIEYEKSKFIKEKKDFELVDTKNIFLKGYNPYDGLKTFFGIWQNKYYLVIVTLISDRQISYDYSLDKGIYTDNYIRKYLEDNNYVETISKEQFREQFQKILKKLEI